MAKIKEMLGIKPPPEEHEEIGEAGLDKSVLQEDQQEYLEQDISILEDEDGTREQKLQKVAEKEVQSAAEDSLKKLHVIKLGRCPICNEHLRQHLFASICEACGWHEFDAPRNGPVRVHLRHQQDVIEGDRVYVVKTGAALIIKNDLVVSKVPRDAYDWIEYLWSENEIDQRHKQVVDRMQITCGWCNGTADSEMDGFHMVQVAFGASQERYCFCCDECYEEFRKMFPARVHRNCYERNCSECSLCLKRYGDEAEGVRMMAKDYLAPRKRKS
ncbi:MAG: hypothetical protein HN742_35350 [Lentisphaerae bacterium]|jgi:hypothetical protein|nr:hypothetical protein [Lentisphaerota bacterium]MBT4820083.1 hypothetical protein [Lentisphaerota bacterium]MBT5604679.1 hypothetical protein [Lentisphaerota bacterium]MBT7053821.1 hypothetical protein [Lentisphaerota bacterium]MBT7847200.1 hypothetical protein [Lentisphaerota bacterium]